MGEQMQVCKVTVFSLQEDWKGEYHKNQYDTSHYAFYPLLAIPLYEGLQRDGSCIL